MSRLLGRLLSLVLFLDGAASGMPPPSGAELDALLAKSDLVVEANVSESPGGFVNEFRVSWLFRVDHPVLLFGRETLGRDLPVSTGASLQGVHSQGPEPPARFGEHVILFLKRPAPARPHEENAYLIVDPSGLWKYSAELKEAIRSAAARRSSIK
jgi:hypothetical protein